MVAMNHAALQAARDEFTGLLSELTGRLSHRFRHIGPESRAEATAEGIAHAWILFLSARQRERQVTAGTLAFYAGRMVQAGRKAGGGSLVDALADTSITRQQVGRHVSLDSPGVSAAGFFRTFGDRRWRWPVLDYVAPHIDLEAFLAGCTARERQVVGMRLKGYRKGEVAARLHVTPAAVSQ